MKIVLLTVPPSSGSQSMPRFARLIGEGMRERGHQVEYMTSGDLCSARSSILPRWLRKWSAYADQYLLFPRVLREKVATAPRDTLFVVTDQGLGMWVPPVSGRPHVIHCHDLLAIRSALGEFPENPTGFSGRIYQRMILSGLKQGGNFISVSEATCESLTRLLGIPGGISEVVPNALNRPVDRLDPREAAALLGNSPVREDRRPILHVGGNQWYKNRLGVLRLYERYARSTRDPRPLCMAGAPPEKQLISYYERMDCRELVTFVTGLNDAELDAYYSLASLLLHPSLEEGFGWPVAEAQAHGCPVITTGIPPMTEVGGASAFYIPRMPVSGEIRHWLDEGADMIKKVLELPQQEREERIRTGLVNASRFDRESFLDACESFYRKILRTSA
ncbi:MAG: glycosyltransferase [bacterium]